MGPSVQTFNINIGIEARVLFLENHLRELSHLYASPQLESEKRARLDAEMELVHHMLSHYRTALAMELAFDDLPQN